MRTRALVDTHVVSRTRKGELAAAAGVDWLASSVVLQELFLMQRGEGYRYCPPLLHRARGLPSSPQVARHFREQATRRPVAPLTDRIALDFAGEHPSRYELGHSAISQLVSFRHRYVLRGCSSVLPKTGRRVVMDEFDFLVGRGVTTAPLDQQSAQLGMDLLGRFLGSGRAAKGNLRNTLNDMFLLAQSQRLGLQLVSDDVLLGEFGTEVGCTTRRTGELVVIEPPGRTEPRRRPARGTKGYVNGRWRATAC